MRGIYIVSNVFLGNVSRMLVVEFYLRTAEDEALLSDALVCEIEQYDIFKVHRLLPIEKGAELASGTSRVFTCEDKAFLTSLSSEFDDVEQAYEAFCKQWDFEMTSLPRRCKVTRAWCKYVSKKPSLSEVQSIWNPISVEFGNFTSKQIFECSKIICQEMEVMMEDSLRLEFDQKDITLTKVVGETRFSVLIPLTSLHEFTVCCASMDGQTLHLYLPLKTPPNVKTNNRNFKDAVVDNKVVCMTFPSSSWKELRRTLAVPEIMPVSVFNTRVKHEHAFEYAHSVKKKEATLEGYQVLNNCLWLMKVLKGKREFCLPNRNLLFFYEKLEEALVGGYTGKIALLLRLNPLGGSIGYSAGCSFDITPKLITYYAVLTTNAMFSPTIAITITKITIINITIFFISITIIIFVFIIMFIVINIIPYTNLCSTTHIPSHHLPPLPNSSPSSHFFSAALHSHHSTSTNLTSLSHISN